MMITKHDRYTDSYHDTTAGEKERHLPGHAGSLVDVIHSYQTPERSYLLIPHNIADHLSSSYLLVHHQHFLLPRVIVWPDPMC